jgi:tetratricopeptide (TPR) repeat protein
VLASLALASATHLARAQGASHEEGHADDRIHCSSAKPETGIIACTHLIDDKRLDELERAAALKNRAFYYQQALRGRGFVHLRRHEAGLAIIDLTAAIALNPNDALAYHFRASAHETKKDLRHAELDEAAALRLNPKGWGHSR